MKNRIFWVIADLESAGAGTGQNTAITPETGAFPWALFGALGVAEQSSQPQAETPSGVTGATNHGPQKHTAAAPVAAAPATPGASPGVSANDQPSGQPGQRRLAGNSIVELTRLRRLLAEVEELELYGESQSGLGAPQRPTNRAFKERPELP